MKRLVLIGAGHAHLFVLEAWAKRREAFGDTELVLVSIEPVQHYSGMISGLLAGQYDEDALSFDLVAICRGVRGRFLTGGAASLDATRGVVTLASGERLDFDVASVDIGSLPASDHVPGVRERALVVKPIHRALEMKRRLEGTGPVLVAGAGVAGVELALCVQAMSKRRVHLVSATKDVPSHADASLVRTVERLLRERGITWTAGARVMQVDETSVKLDSNERILADDVVWMTGSRSSTLVHDASAATDAHGYLRVDDTLRSTSHPSLFGAGDAVSLTSAPRLPKSGVVAVRQGPILAHNLLAALTGGTLRTFAPPRSPLAILNCGDGTAIGTWHGFAAHGRWMMRLKDRIDRRFMRRFQKLGDARG